MVSMETGGAVKSRVAKQTSVKVLTVKFRNKYEGKDWEGAAMCTGATVFIRLLWAINERC